MPFVAHPNEDHVTYSILTVYYFALNIVFLFVMTVSTAALSGRLGR